jgi:hypothetical protein
MWQEHFRNWIEPATVWDHHCIRSVAKIFFYSSSLDTGWFWPVPHEPCSVTHDRILISTSMSTPFWLRTRSPHYSRHKNENINRGWSPKYVSRFSAISESDLANLKAVGKQKKYDMCFMRSHIYVVWCWSLRLELGSAHVHPDRICLLS